MSRLLPVLAALTLAACLSEIGRLLPDVPSEPPRLGGPCDFCELIDDDGCFPGTWQDNNGALTCVLQNGGTP